VGQKIEVSLRVLFQIFYFVVDVEKMVVGKRCLVNQLNSRFRREFYSQCYERLNICYGMRLHDLLNSKLEDQLWGYLFDSLEIELKKRLRGIG